MGEPSFEAPALFSLLLFLGLNYLIGYEFGQLLTGSNAVSVAIALLTPCLSLLGVALFGSRNPGEIEAARIDA